MIAWDFTFQIVYLKINSDEQEREVTIVVVFGDYIVET